MESLNLIIEYIENNLDSEIKYDNLAKIIGVNEHTLQIIFSFITGISISEYIRKRRLSKSALELKENPNIKIMDLSVKYQYDSATSFSRAFYKMHNIKPSKINKESYISDFPILNIKALKINKEEIEYTIKEIPELILYGLNIRCKVKDLKDKIVEFWKATKSNKEHTNVFNETVYGIIKYDNKCSEQEMATYYIASKEKFKGSRKLTITASKRAIFKIKETSGEYMSEFSKNIYANWIPASGYNVLYIPEIEEYKTNGETNWYLAIE